MAFAPSIAHAQLPETEPPAESDRSDQQVLACRNAPERTQSPTFEVGTGFAGSGVNLIADGDAKTVSLAASRVWQGCRPNRLSTNAFSAKLSTDVSNKDDSSGSFVTDLGLAAGTSLEFTFSRFWGSNPPIRTRGPDRDALKATLLTRCLRKAVTKVEKDFCNSPTTTIGDLESHMTQAERRLMADPWTSATSHLLAVTVGVSHKKFEFRNPMTLAKDDEKHEGWSAAVQYGQSRLLGALGRTYVGAGASYKSEYKLPDARILCALPPAAAPQGCFEAAFAPPNRKERIALFGVGRSQDFKLLGVPAALQIKPAYEFNTHVWGIEGSLYFVPAKVGLRGGIRLKVQTDDNDPNTDDDNRQLGFFVGSSF